jgi:FKBP-type peptidyl-prolyl cis-trans isomerase FkpA
MRRIPLRPLAVVTALLVIGVAVACRGGGVPGAGGSGSRTPTTDEEKTFYALGLSIGRNLAVFNLSPTEVQFVFAGIEDQVTGAKPAVEISQFGPKIQELARKRGNAKSDAEKEKGAAFLAKIAAEKSVTPTPSGLLYVEEQAGTGDSPVATDRVKVNYRGTLIDGTEFDSSSKHGNQPAEFNLNQVVPCWTEGVQKMKPGGKAKLYCPSKIAYGDRGQPPNIPGGATLVFEIELVSVTKPQPGAAPASPSPMGMGAAMHPSIPGHPGMTISPRPIGATPPAPPTPAPAHP